ncbi:MAG: radical SAM protein, partial [Clostridia bacterium]|nr:radical SAM protein [Clostridia bacterium]
MNYAEIKTTDIANGEGIRVSLFVSGCTHRCKNCFNEIAWDFHYGEPFTEATQEFLLKALAPDYISGLSLLGGEPFEPQNQEGLLPFVERFKKQFP